MNILITGSKGFIGSNLKIFLLLKKKYLIFEHNRHDAKAELIKKIQKVDIIIHTGAENRSDKKENFEQNNYQLTRTIIDNIKPKTHIIFTSTTKINDETQYGKTKKKAENILKKFYKKKKYSLSILRLPNIFGKWGRPYHNSVVATYCYNASRNIKSIINNPKTELELLYIDDLVAQIGKIIKINKKETYPKLRNIQKVNLATLHKKIYSIAQSRIKLNIDVVKTKLEKKLYSTYLTYLPKKQFHVNFKKNIDKRGFFSELTRSKINGQMSYFTINPGYERGNHFHNSKVEKFFPLFGNGKIIYKNIISKKKITYNFNSKDTIIYEAIPGWSHKLINNTKKVAIFLLWANEIFDNKNPDTYYHKV